MEGGKFILAENKAGIAQDKYLLDLETLYEQLEKRNINCSNRPLFEDLAQTHSFFIKKYYKPTLPLAYEFRRQKINNGSFGGQNVFSLDIYGDFICDIFLKVEIEPLQCVNPNDKCNYYDFLAHRLVKNVIMEFKDGIIDQYDGEAYNIFYNYFVPPEKKRGWKLAMGQEIEIDCFVKQDASDNYREKKKIVAGLQTPKNRHEKIELWIPILFEFCRKPAQAFFSCKVPWGQRNLKINLNNITDCFTATGPTNLPSVSGELWINNIFIDDKIKDILMRGTYRTFLRVFKESKFNCSVGPQLQRLDDLRYPIENIYFGLKPSAQANIPDKWHIFSKLTNQTAIFPVRVPTGIPVPFSQLAFLNCVYYDRAPCMDNITFNTKGTPVIRAAGNGFYSRAVPLAKGITPEDEGILQVSFTEARQSRLYGNENDEIGGYYNVSNQREFFIAFDCLEAGNVYMLAHCLNWIDIDKEGTIKLRYKS